MKPSLNETTVTPSLIGFIDFPRFRRIVTEFLPSFVFFLTERWRIPFDWVLPVFLPSFTGFVPNFYHVLLGLIEFYCFFTKFYEIKPSFTVFTKKLWRIGSRFTGFYWVLSSFTVLSTESTGFYRDYTEFYQIKPSFFCFFIEFYCFTLLNHVFTEFYWVYMESYRLLLYFTGFFTEF